MLPALSLLSGPSVRRSVSWNNHILAVWIIPLGGHRPGTAMPRLVFWKDHSASNTVWGLRGVCVCVCLCKFEGQENGGKFPGSDKRNGSLSLYPSSPITPLAFRGLGEGQWRPTRQEGVGFFSSLICLLPSQPRSLVIYSSGRGVEGRPPWRLLPERP